MLRLSVIKSRFVFPDGVSLPPGWDEATVLWSWREGGPDIRLGLPLAVWSLAQLVERPVEAGEVAGSSPAGSAGVRWWRLVPPVAVNYRAPLGVVVQFSVGDSALKKRTVRVRIPLTPLASRASAECSRTVDPRRGGLSCFDLLA